MCVCCVLCVCVCVMYVVIFVNTGKVHTYLYSKSGKCAYRDFHILSLS